MYYSVVPPYSNLRSFPSRVREVDESQLLPSREHLAPLSNKDILRYPSSIRFSRKQKTSLAEVYGFGRAKGLNRLFPSSNISSLSISLSIEAGSPVGVLL